MEKGDAFALGSTALWSVFPVLGVIMLSSAQPIYLAGVSTLCAALFFAGWMTYKREWKLSIGFDAWKNVIMATLLIGVGYYILIYSGLQSTTAGNASIILLLEVLFTFLLLGRSEGLTPQRIIGAIAMVTGGCIILLPGLTGFHSGDFLIVLAAAVAPAGNYYQQKARLHVSSATIMFWRSLGGGIVLIIAAMLFEASGNGISLWLLLLNGIVLFGIQKVLWIEAIHRIPITRAISLGTLAPALTLIVAFFVLGEVPTWVQLFGALLIVSGALLILYRDKSFIKNAKLRQ